MRPGTCSCVNMREEIMKMNCVFLLTAAGLAVAGSFVAPPRGGSAVAKSKGTSLPAAQPMSAKDREVGAKAHPEMVAEFGGEYKGAQVPYIISIGRKISMQTGISPNGSDFTVTVLNSPVNNAFAIPGGYVYVTRQLVGLMNNEAELASVMGHEDGHVAARHSEKRQKSANLGSILGAIGQVAAGAALGNTGLGELAQNVIGSGSQLVLLRYSRKQETQADDLGISYLQKAGYDPMAASTMLASLAAQTSLDATVSGNARSVPAWASTHPDPQARVARARQIASSLPVYPGSNRVLNRDTFLANIDGIMYDDDPEQGVVRGQQFIHPTMKLKFTAPQGYSIGNSTSAVTVSGSNGKAQFSGATIPSGGLDAYVKAVFTKLGGSTTSLSVSDIKKTQINNIPAAYATARTSTQSGQVDVTVVAYDFGSGNGYNFVLLTPAGQGFGAFQPMVQSFSRVTTVEAAAIKPRVLRVVTVKKGDSLTTLASRMAYDDRQLERFLVLNALSSNAALVAGQKVKIITF